MRTFRWIGLVAALALATTAATARGNPAGGTAKAAESPIVVTAKKKVAEFSALQKLKFPFPTDSYDPGVKKVAIITAGNQAPVQIQQARVVQQAFKAMGWIAPTIYDGQFSPATQAGLINQAVQRGEDAIELMAVDVGAVKSPIENALAKKIVVVCLMCESGAAWHKKGVIDVTVDFSTMGEMAAWFVIADSNGKAKAITFNEPAFSSVRNRNTGFDRVFKQCTTCTLVKRVTIPAADLSKPGPPGWTALLTSQPKGSFDYAVAYADVLAVPMAKTLKQAGRTDVKLTGYDAESTATALIKSDPAYVATIAMPYEFADWAVADTAARKLAGKKLWATVPLPPAVITKANVAGYKPFPAPPGDWRQRFKKSWGKG